MIRRRDQTASSLVAMVVCSACSLEIGAPPVSEPEIETDALTRPASCRYDADTDRLTVTIPSDSMALLARTTRGGLSVRPGPITACTPAAAVAGRTAIELTASAGAEKLTIDLRGGAVGMLHADMGSGLDQVWILGSNSDDGLTLGQHDGTVTVLPAGDAAMRFEGVERVGVNGREGDDVISAAGGEGTGESVSIPLTLQGGAGADTITGGAGDDALHGGDGDDTLEGGPGLDTLVCGQGTDVVASLEAQDRTPGSDCEERTHALEGVTDLTATPSPGQVQLRWSAVEGAASYTITRRDAAPTLIRIGNVTTTEFLDGGLSGGMALSYRVQAVDGVTNGPYALVTAKTPLGTPTGVTAQVESGGGSILIAWEPVADAIRYRVFRSAQPGRSYVALGWGTGTSYLDEHPLPGLAYYAVAASTLRVGGARSADVTIRLVPLPVIGSFVAGNGTIAPGGTTTLSWSVAGATTITIDQGVGPVTGSNVSVSPADSTTYTLRATNDGGEVTALANVDVVPLPVIASFTTSAGTIAPGGSATLGWSVSGATSLSIDRGVGTVTGTSTTVSPTASGTYTLTATNAAGSVTAQASVAVVPLPVIASFTTSAASIAAGGSATLSWSVTGATSLAIDRGVGAVTGTSTTVSPASSGTYTLTATNAAGSVTATVTVSVVTTRPVISSFTASPAAIASGGTTTLAWSVTGATSLALDNGVGPVTGTSRSVTATTTTTYTLSATNLAGTTTASVTVAVDTAPPVINRFGAAPYFVTAGSAATLTWSVSGARSLVIDQGVGAVSGTSINVTPAASTTYLLRASNGAGSVLAFATVTVAPQAPAPHIQSFSASRTALFPGELGTNKTTSSTLRWVVTNATSVKVNGSTATGTSLAVSPSSTTTYTLTATGAGGTATATLVVAVNTATFLAPTPPTGTPDVTFTLDSGLDAHAISRHIYGAQGGMNLAASTYDRLGGNRWTAYNYETNASNAGSDYGPFSNDTYLSGSSTPGDAALPYLVQNQTSGRSTLATIPIQGWVAADKSGNVDLALPLDQHFLRSPPRKSASALTTTPDLTDRLVYGDEFAALLASAATDLARPIHLSLDNEPDLWSSTHAEIEKAPVTYAELTEKSISAAVALKDAVPGAVVFGPASYGFGGYYDLQGASDAATYGQALVPTSSWWLGHYLGQMRVAGDRLGRRVFDVLDVHWYSEATDAAGNSIRDNTCDPLVRAQAPRSLWDPTYVENSWIANDVLKWIVYPPVLQPVQILTRLRDQIIAVRSTTTTGHPTGYPGTKIAITEYNYGGESTASGGVAQADALGVFGREGVFAANYWQIASSATFARGAFRSFRNYDGAGATFGDTSVRATTSNDALASVYASTDSTGSGRVVVVAINKTNAALVAAVTLVHTQSLTHARTFVLSSASTVTGGEARPKATTAPTPSGNGLNLTLPAMSVTTLELTP